MRTVTFTEFRKQMSRFISEVEKGEHLLILRHRRPVAEVRSAVSAGISPPAWKQPGLRLAAEGADLSAAIIEERSREDLR